MGLGKTWHWFKVTFVSLIAAATHVFITWLICAETAVCGELIMHRCLRTVIDVCLGI
jgi:hypothetical protein